MIRDAKTALAKRKRHADRERASYHKEKALAANLGKKNSIFCLDSEWCKKPSEEAHHAAHYTDAVRDVFRTDPKAMYDSALARLVKQPDGTKKKQSLAPIHDILLDFDNLDLPEDVKRYSSLPKYCQWKDGRLEETWLYWRTLDQAPQVEYGPHNDIAKMFYKEFWQGVVIRLCGTGRLKCILLPRGFLKTTLCGILGTLLRIIRDPGSQTVIRTAETALAEKILSGIKGPFSRQGQFSDAFCDLGPPPRSTGRWNEKEMQLIVYHPDVNATVEAAGMLTESTGGHALGYRCDDVIAIKNSANPMQIEKACRGIQAMQAQRSPGSYLTDQGTRWAEDDPHEMFVGKPGATPVSGILSHDASFMVATLLDGDKTAHVKPLNNGLVVTPLGYGKPMWPEVWPMAEIESLRRSMPDDRLWFSQEFNQWAGTTARIFNRQWIRNIPETLVDVKGNFFKTEGLPTAKLAELLELDVYMGIDTASGLPKQTSRLDPTGCFIIGQTKDRKNFYFLDGFKERLQAPDIAKGIVQRALKWYQIVRGYGGSFRVGYEKNAYVQFLEPLLEAEQRKLGVESIFPYEHMSHEGKYKPDRIRTLQQPYSEGRIFWPVQLIVEPIGAMAPYDMREALESEWVNYHPTATADSLLDAHVYAWKLTLPSEWKPKPDPEIRARLVGEYSRESEDEGAVSLCGYGGDEGAVAL